MNRRCPKDGAVLRKKQKQGTNFHLCGKCHGIWVEMSELEERLPRASCLKKHASGLNPSWHGSAISQTLHCPLDQSLLVMRFLEGVDIDICPDCHAIWLDAGEIGQLDPALKMISKRGPQTMLKNMSPRTSEPKREARPGRANLNDHGVFFDLVLLVLELLAEIDLD